MSLDPNEVAYDDGYEAGYASGFDDGMIEGQAFYDGEYDRGYDNGVEDGYNDGRADALAGVEDTFNVFREIENDMFWSIQDGTIDDHNALIARVKHWHDRIRTELEDAPL